MRRFIQVLDLFLTPSEIGQSTTATVRSERIVIIEAMNWQWVGLLGAWWAGIRIVFEQTGEIGGFDAQTLLVNLVTALGLLAVATVLVDGLMLCVAFNPL